jgi:hypothetical protein
MFTMARRLVPAFLLAMFAIGFVMPTHAAPLAQTKPTIRRGDTGALVREAQARLNIWIMRARPAGIAVLPVTGTFGPGTEAAVKAFQRASGLSVVGFIGPQTWAKLPPLTGAAASAPGRSAPPAPTHPAAPRRCDPSYPDVCIPPYSQVGDLDCPDVPYTNFRVIGSDPHRFDRDHDGIGCER